MLHNSIAFQKKAITSLVGFQRLIEPLGEDWVFRGQADYRWNLITSLDRMLGNSAIPDPYQQKRFDEVTSLQLELFRDSAIGRVKSNIRELTDVHVLAIGQHYGLRTPLLDWTESPYVSMFFALSETINVPGKCTVWAMHRHKLPELLRHQGLQLQLHHVRIDENPRIVAQRGLFTQVKGGGCIMHHTNNMTNRDYEKVYNAFPSCLMKIDIEYEKSSLLLRSLRQMNISWLTLYPDLEGSAKYANTTHSLSS